MARYESQVKTIVAAQENVYKRIADLSELQTIKDNMPLEVKQQIKEKIKEAGQGKVEISNFHFDTDTASFSVMNMPMCIRIIEREPMKTVKFAAEQSPVDVTLWVQLIGKGPYDTRMKVTLDVDLPFYLKPMVGNKLEGAADQIADMLAKIPY